MRKLASMFVLLGLSFPLYAETPAEFQAAYAKEAAQETPAYKGPSAARGQQFFQARHGGEWSCASCHTNTPTGPGKHQVTSKPIQPMAPAANPERFTSSRKVEKWFKRNCGDVLDRACTAAEKADVIAYLNSLK